LLKKTKEDDYGQHTLKAKLEILTLSHSNHQKQQKQNIKRFLILSFYYFSISLLIYVKPTSGFIYHYTYETIEIAKTPLCNLPIISSLNFKDNTKIIGSVDVNIYINVATEMTSYVSFNVRLCKGRKTHFILDFGCPPSYLISIHIHIYYEQIDIISYLNPPPLILYIYEGHVGLDEGLFKFSQNNKYRCSDIFSFFFFHVRLSGQSLSDLILVSCGLPTIRTTLIDDVFISGVVAVVAHAVGGFIITAVVIAVAQGRSWFPNEAQLYSMSRNKGEISYDYVTSEDTTALISWKLRRQKYEMFQEYQHSFIEISEYLINFGCFIITSFANSENKCCLNFFIAAKLGIKKAIFVNFNFKLFLNYYCTLCTNPLVFDIFDAHKGTELHASPDLAYPEHGVLCSFYYKDLTEVRFHFYYFYYYFYYYYFYYYLDHSESRKSTTNKLKLQSLVTILITINYIISKIRSFNCRHSSEIVRIRLLYDIETNPGPANSKLSVITLNCRGLGNIEKSRLLFNKMYKLSRNSNTIILLQETMVSDETYVKMAWRGKSVVTPGTGNSKGCITLVGMTRRLNTSIT